MTNKIMERYISKRKFLKTATQGAIKPLSEGLLVEHSVLLFLFVEIS